MRGKRASSGQFEASRGPRGGESGIKTSLAPWHAACTTERVITEVVLRGPSNKSQLQLRKYAQAYLRRNLRCNQIELSRGREQQEVGVSVPDWQHADVSSFDRLFESLQRHGDFRVVLRANDWLEGLQPAYELLNHFQRLLPLPRDVTPIPQLERILAAHRELYPTYSAPDRARYYRAVDAWRWTMRLSSAPPLGVQLAALFQHVDAPAEQLLQVGGHGGRREEAQLGCVRAACSVLGRLALDQRAIYRTAELILGREGARRDPELCLLRDADDVSFLSLGSGEFLRQRGREATRQKLEQLLGRMSEAAVCLALMTRQPPEVAVILEDIVQSEIAPESGVRRA